MKDVIWLSDNLLTILLLFQWGMPTRKHLSDPFLRPPRLYQLKTSWTPAPGHGWNISDWRASSWWLWESLQALSGVASVAGAQAEILTYSFKVGNLQKLKFYSVELKIGFPQKNSDTFLMTVICRIVLSYFFILTWFKRPTKRIVIRCHIQSNCRLKF